MISGTFHPLAQEWRYYSREKSLIHTLHLAQLPSGTPGDTVLIATTPNLLNSKGLGLGSFSVPNLQLPGPPSVNTAVFNTFLQSVGSSCYACVSNTKVITAQKQCGVSIDSWTSALMQITFSPTKAGRYLLHIEAQSDQRSSSYQGPNNDGFCQVNGTADGTQVLTASAQMFESGMSAATKEVIGVLHCSSTGLAQVNSTFVVKGPNNGDPAGSPVKASISAFLMLIDPVAQ